LTPRFFGGVHFDFSYNRTPRFIDPHRELPYPDQEREGRLQSAERAVPTFINSSKATNLLSAWLRADSRHAP